MLCAPFDDYASLEIALSGGVLVDEERASEAWEAGIRYNAFGVGWIIPLLTEGGEMTCVHLRKLYQLCQEEDLRLSGTDLIRIVCHQCGQQEVCPSNLTDDSEVPTATETEGPDAPPSS